MRQSCDTGLPKTVEVLNRRMDRLQRKVWRMERQVKKLVKENNDLKKMLEYGQD